MITSINIFMRTLLLLTAFLILITACSSKKQPADHSDIVVVPEVYQTERDTANNVDTPAIWFNPNGEVWLLATAKETDVVLVYDASSGKKLHTFSEEGTGLGQLDRPNSIAVVEDLAVIIERDNHRVQVFELPEFRSLGVFGAENLIKPYGLSIIPGQNGSFRLFVTDNYETEDEQVPPIEELGNRIHEFSFSIEKGLLQSHHVKAFGATEGEGALMVVESLMADEGLNRLIIADEDSLQNHLKVYDLFGNFTGKIIGEGLFKYQTEGIALYRCPDNQGYWIATDQSHEENTFHVFDRSKLNLIGSFQNPKTTNTDGITLTQKAFPGFENGAFFPIHDDGNISAVSWADIASAMGLRTCMEE